MLGGARSGKSSFAEQLLARQGEVDYVACGLVPDGSDPEWTDRVAAAPDPSAGVLADDRDGRPAGGARPAGAAGAASTA